MGRKRSVKRWVVSFVITDRPNLNLGEVFLARERVMKEIVPLVLANPGGVEIERLTLKGIRR